MADFSYLTETVLNGIKMPSVESDQFGYCIPGM